MISPLEKARQAYKSADDYRHTMAVLGGAIGLVLDEPTSMAGYAPYVAQAAGLEPDTEKDAEFLAASARGVVDEDGEPILDDEGEEMGLVAVASAIAGAPVGDAKAAIYTLFSSGEPPKLAKHALANAAFVHRTVLTAGAEKAIGEAPEA